MALDSRGERGPTLASPLTELLGGRTANRLAKADLHTASDLVRYYPRAYNERGTLTDLSSLRVGERVTVWARISSVTNRTLDRRGGAQGRRPRSITTIVITDGRRTLECTFFNQPWMREKLPTGTEALFSGKVSAFRGKPQLSSPDIAFTDGSLGGAADILETLETFAGGLIPVYRLTEKLTSGLLQQSVKHVLDVLGDIPDPLPPDVVRARKLMGLDEALKNIHRPGSAALLQSATKRLKYDEALALQLVLARRRARARLTPATPCPATSPGLLTAFDDSLPFTLTDGQREVGAVICADLAGMVPMNRLLHGEVGSGKTLVALRAMLQVIDAGKQAALLAPTEVLAAQHVRSLRELLGPLGRGGELGSAPQAIAVRLLTGSTKTAVRRDITIDIASGRPGIVVGTHALFSKDVMFTNLGLVVVDEQHRFGVEQRDQLVSGQTSGDDHNPPHVLVMTATPIPRTVAMTVYGDLDTSTLTELPAQRAAIATTVVPAGEKPAWLDRAWQRIREEVAAGHQAYVVCPRIGDDDDEGDETSGDDRSASRKPPEAALHVAEQLRAGPLADVRVEVLHGRMSAADKDAVMQAFAAGEIDVLVATTVIEVGVDVANASVMVIMDADRFGLSTLHQLRGRIGRGQVPGVCLLVTTLPPATTARRRLDVVASTTDGFAVAEADLAQRREGDILGTSQAGRASSLKLLSLTQDNDVISAARDDAREFVGNDPYLIDQPALAAMSDALVASQAQDYLSKG